MITVGVDTGKRQCGVSLFDGRQLVWADLVKVPVGDYDPRDVAAQVAGAVPQRPDVVFIEKPQQYPNSPVPRESLEALSLVAGAISQAFPREADTACIYPREWKGQVPKPVMLRRIKAHLSDAEMAVVSDLGLASSVVHNVWDAVGIGLWAVGRIGSRKR